MEERGRPLRLRMISAPVAGNDGADFSGACRRLFLALLYLALALHSNAVTVL